MQKIKAGVMHGINDVRVIPVHEFAGVAAAIAEQVTTLQVGDRNTAEPNVKIHLDAYHMNIEENNFYAPTKKAAPYLCHYYLSESHHGTPGTGTVNWEEIYGALGEVNYTGGVGLESFIESSEAMRAATCVWRPMAASSDALLTDGLQYLKGLEKKYYR